MCWNWKSIRLRNKFEDFEFLINFIILSHFFRFFFHRLLSAFEYLKYFSILSICFLFFTTSEESNKRKTATKIQINIICIEKYFSFSFYFSQRSWKRVSCYSLHFIGRRNRVAFPSPLNTFHFSWLKEVLKIFQPFFYDKFCVEVEVHPRSAFDDNLSTAPMLRSPLRLTKPR